MLFTNLARFFCNALEVQFELSLTTLIKVVILKHNHMLNNFIIKNDKDNYSISIYNKGNRNSTTLFA